MDEFLEEEGKLGQRFTSADLLEEIDIGYGDRPRPTFISAKLDPEYKYEKCYSNMWMDAKPMSNYIG